MKNLILQIVFTCLLMSMMSAAEIEIRGQITYVTVSEFYINIGKKDHLQIDDRIQVQKDGSPYFTGKIIHLSTNSAICTWEGDYQPEAGLTVITVIHERKGEKHTTRQDDSLISPSDGKSVKKTSKTPEVSGSLSYQLFVSDRTDKSDVQQKSVFSLDGKNLFGIPVMVSLFGSLKNTNNDPVPDPVIQQAGIQYHMINQSWDITAGRIVENSYNETSNVDGLQISKKLKNFKISTSIGRWNNQNGTDYSRGKLSLDMKPKDSHDTVLRGDITHQKSGGENESYSTFFIRSILFRKLQWMTQNTIKLAGGNRQSRGWKQGIAGLNLTLSEKWTTNIQYYFIQQDPPESSQSNTVWHPVRSLSFTAIFSYMPGVNLSFGESIYRGSDRETSNGYNFTMSMIRVPWFPVNTELSADFVRSGFYRSYRYNLRTEWNYSRWDMIAQAANVQHIFRTDDSRQNINYFSVYLNRRIGKILNAGFFTEFTCTDNSCANLSSLNLHIRF